MLIQEQDGIRYLKINYRTMEQSEKNLTKKISPYKIVYPIIIGLAVVSYMLYKEFDIKAFEQITFTWTSVLWLLVAIMCMLVRDLGYVIRIKVLSGNRLNWIKSIRIIFLWNLLPPSRHRLSRDQPGHSFCKQRRD